MLELWFCPPMAQLCAVAATNWSMIQTHMQQEASRWLAFRDLGTVRCLRDTGDTSGQEGARDAGDGAGSSCWRATWEHRPPQGSQPSARAASSPPLPAPGWWLAAGGWQPGLQVGSVPVSQSPSHAAGVVAQGPQAVSLGRSSTERSPKQLTCTASSLELMHPRGAQRACSSRPPPHALCLQVSQPGSRALTAGRQVNGGKCPAPEICAK